MTPDHDIAIRRRPDGSIDIDFYARRAALLRRAALREEVARCIGNLARFAATLKFPARSPESAWPSHLGR